MKKCLMDFGWIAGTISMVTILGMCCLAAQSATESEETILRSKKPSVRFGPCLTTELVGELVVTSYRSTVRQCDSTPFHTSIGEHVHPHGVAVSQDLLLSGRIKYGDTLFIEGVGFKIVNDTMNARWKNRIDVWLSTYEEEKEFDAKFRGKKLHVWKVSSVEIVKK